MAVEREVHEKKGLEAKTTCNNILMTLTSRPFFREKINRYVPKGCFNYNRHATFSSLIQADSIVFLWKTNAYGVFQEVTKASISHNLQYGFKKMHKL